MSTPNFQITDKHTGKKYWISRSVVVCPCVFKIVKHKIYALIEKRGKAVSHTDEWCCPCGYLDWDEDIYQACAREVREETGVDIKPNVFEIMDINSNPKEFDRQNVSIRCCAFVSEHTEIDISKIETKEEVDELMWLKVADFTSTRVVKFDESSLNDPTIRWGFNHNKLIKDILRKYLLKEDIYAS